MKKMIVTLGFLLWGGLVWAHCEVPCGVYGDDARFEEIAEHLTTIEKAMDQIKILSEKPGENANQITRWVMNKESHAEKLQHVLSQYFLHQRLKPTEPDNKDAYQKYTRELVMVHTLLVNAMKAKQTVDKEWVDKSRKLLKSFKESYLSAK